MSLLTLLRAAIAGSTSDGPILDEGDRIENGEPFIALQIGQRSGVPLVLPYLGTCDTEFPSSVGYAAVQTGAKSSNVLASLPVAQCDDNGDLPIGVPLVGVQMGAKSGQPLFLVTCEPCTTDPCDRLANRDPVYPTTLYLEPDTFIFPTGLTFPMALTETSPGSLVWEGTQTGMLGLFFAQFKCLGSQFYLTITYNFFYTYSGADPAEDSLDPFVCTFTIDGFGITWTISE